MGIFGYIRQISRMPPNTPTPYTMLTLARRCISRLSEVKDRFLRCVNNNRSRRRIGKKARENPLTRVTVKDVIRRKHELVCVHGRKAVQYVFDGHLQYDLVSRMVVACPRFRFTRSKAKILCSVYLDTTSRRMFTITCTYHEAKRLEAFCRFNALDA